MIGVSGGSSCSGDKMSGCLPSLHERDQAMPLGIGGSVSDEAHLTDMCSQDPGVEMAEVFKKVFDQYSSVVLGRRLMNFPELLHFFRDFTCNTGLAPARSKQERLYGDEIQLQQDTGFRFDLSRAQSSRGLCFQSFQVLLAKAMPYGVACSVVKEKFQAYAGSTSKRCLEETAINATT